MESAPEIINGIIMKIFPTEIASGILIMGFMIFFFCFYGTKEWKNFSDLEKIIFSILTGAIFWYLFIFPLAIGFETLKIFFTYTEDLDVVNKSIHDFYYISFFIVTCFIIARILSKPPLFYNKKFLKLPELIGILIIFMYLPLFFILISIYFSDYRYYIIILTYPIASSIIFLLGLDIVFIKIISYGSDIKLAIIIEYKKMVYNFRGVRILILIVIFLLIPISLYFGNSYYNPSFVKEELEITGLEIPILPIDTSYNGNLSGNLVYNNQFSLEYGLVKWAFISRNFTINGVYNQDNSSKKYEFSGNSVVLRGANRENITLTGNRKINVDNSFYNLEKEYINHIQIWNISFNRKEYEISINEIWIRDIPENLKLIDSKKYGLSFDKERLDEDLNKSVRELTIQSVVIPDVLYSDGINITKISLYFMDNS